MISNSHYLMLESINNKLKLPESMIPFIYGGFETLQQPSTNTFFILSQL